MAKEENEKEKNEKEKNKPKPCPKWLNDTAKKEWRRVAKILAEEGKDFTDKDLKALEAYCINYAKWQRCEQIIDEKGYSMDLWDTCTKKVDTEDLKGWKCWGGLDLSSKNDITGFVLVFYEETTGRFIVVPYLYTPKETVAYRQHKDNNPYEYWIKKGDLIALDGKYINFDRFLDHATELDETYRIEQIGFDQWGSQTIINRLEDRWEVIPLGQGTKTMTQVINDFENLLVDERIIIAENECFRFMAKNCIAVYDEMLGVKYSKKKSKFKIDGIIAMLMGLLLCIEENGIEHYNPVEYLDAM